PTAVPKESMKRRLASRTTGAGKSSKRRRPAYSARRLASGPGIRSSLVSREENVVSQDTRKEADGTSGSGKRSSPSRMDAFFGNRRRFDDRIKRAGAGPRAPPKEVKRGEPDQRKEAREADNRGVIFRVVEPFAD